MKLPHIIILITMAFLIFSLVVQAYAQEEQPCILNIVNTNNSTIWISNNDEIKDQVSLQEIENSNVIAIAPHNSEKINLGPWFSIYTRMPVTNDMFKREYTVIQRSCKGLLSEPTITMNQIELNQVAPTKFMVIHHDQQYDIPEKEFSLCPDNKKAMWDTNQDQWFCEVMQEEQLYYVPLYSYMYELLPHWIISQWYTLHPQYYNWYHKHPEFYRHLEHAYVAPWKTSWYERWYNQATASEKEFLHAPDTVEKQEHEIPVEPSKVPHGLHHHRVIIQVE